MHKNLEKNLESNYINQEQAEYIEKALENGESVIVSGHRSAGTRVFMVELIQMVMQGGQHSLAQIKGASDVEGKDADYYAYPKPGEDYEETIQAVFNKEGASIVTLKDDELPYSVNKIMKKAFKENGEQQILSLIIAEKIDDVPYVTKISRMELNEKGKIERSEITREI